MKYILAFATTMLIPFMMNAQKNSLAGEYYLKAVMETASGFNLHSDSTFEFFFSYGALDRYGSGTWKVKDDKVIFNSKPSPGSDFKLTDSSKDGNDFITVQFPGVNAQYSSYFYCRIHTSQTDTVLSADRHGRIIVPKAVDSVQLLFEFCPEKSSTFAVDAAKNNVYSFQPQQWIMEYFFRDFELTIKGDHLEGKHPLLTKDLCIFAKE
ncbi:MAG TPA: hypothetical protein PKM63_15195 [Panacibacter sp.]|nr:hypothetical protein [Panacibacter sp.]HNP45635.1 hypothetical protein [Panacibacter sp.]